MGITISDTFLATGVPLILVLYMAYTLKKSKFLSNFLILILKEQFIIKGIEEGLYNDNNIKTKSSNKMEIYFYKDLSSQQKDHILNNIEYFKQITNNKIKDYEYTK